MFRRALAILLPAFALAASVFAAQVPNPASIGHTKGDFGTCPAIGDAQLATPDDPNPGRSDPYLNALKNRDKAPAEADYIHRRISTLLNDQPAGAIAAGSKRRNKWTAAQRASVDTKEKEAIELVGFLAKPPKKEGVESCNCHDENHVDYHLWLVVSEDDARDVAVVVEISPRELADHPRWVQLTRDAANDRTLLRVRGWRTWDQEHPDQLGHTRGTLWEIHPIHEIDVEDENGDWVPIDKP
jgi:hypothetical protein